MPKRKVLKCQHIAFGIHGFHVQRIVDERSELCKNRPKGRLRPRKEDCLL